MSDQETDIDTLHRRAMKGFAECLSRLRNRTDDPSYSPKSFADLSNDIGVSEQVLQRWESGKSKNRPPREVILLFEIPLGLSPTQLNALLRTLDYYPEYPEDIPTTASAQIGSLVRRLLDRFERIEHFELRDLITHYIFCFCTEWDKYIDAVASPDSPEHLSQAAREIETVGKKHVRSIQSCAYGTLAEQYLATGDIEQALRFQMRAVSEEPEDFKRVERLFRQGDMERDLSRKTAEDTYRTAIEILRRIEHRDPNAKILLGRAWRKVGSVYLFVLGDGDAALKHYAYARRLLEGNGKKGVEGPVDLCKLLYQEAWAHDLLGHREESWKARQEGLVLAERLKDPALLALGLRLQGDMYFYRKNYDGAKESYEDALKWAERINDERERALERAKIYRGLGRVQASENRELARAYLNQSADDLRRLKDHPQLGLTLLYYGQLLLGWGGEYLYDAQTRLEEAVDIFKHMPNFYYGTLACVYIAETYLLQGELSKAEPKAREALLLAKATEVGTSARLPRPSALANFVLGRILTVSESRGPEGISCWIEGCRMSMAIPGNSGSKLEEVKSQLPKQVRVLRENGQNDLAATLLAKIRDAFREDLQPVAKELVRFVEGLM